MIARADIGIGAAGTPPDAPVKVLAVVTIADNQDLSLMFSTRTAT